MAAGGWSATTVRWQLLRSTAPFWALLSGWEPVYLFRGTSVSQSMLQCLSIQFAGMNTFLKNLEITFRRDPTNYRPRINKKASGAFV